MNIDVSGKRISFLARKLARWQVGKLARWHVGTLARWHVGTLAAIIMLCAATSSQAQRLIGPITTKSVLVVAVRDNTDNSELNARRLVQAATNSRLDPQLFEQLGHPTSAHPTFNFTEPPQFMIDEYVEMAETSRHYVSLRYPDRTDLSQLERELRGDNRLLYVGVDRLGHFSAFPNDPIFPYSGTFGFDPTRNDYQWAAHNNTMKLPSAWDRNKGWATVGLLDGGPPTTTHPTNLYAIDHPDLQGIVAYNHSWNFIDGSKNLADPGNTHNTSHGTHVLGLIVANTNNNIGIAGTCWTCSVNYGVGGPQEPYTSTAAIWLTSAGSQVINLSGGYDPFFEGTPAPCVSGPSAHPFCIALTNMKIREVVFVAAAGNSRHSNATPPVFAVQFPASEPTAIGVGGIDSLKDLWDEVGSIWPLDAWDITSGPFTGCPVVYPPTERECGSNFSSSTDQILDFVAPSRRVLSTVPQGLNYAPSYVYFPLNDSNFPTTGYAYGTGTSMAAPIVSGIVALLRSANPLIPRTDVYDVLKTSASNFGIYNGFDGNNKAWGLPDADAALAAVQGRVAGIVVQNRLTPMFVSINETDKDRLYTTRPQVAIGAILGDYLREPGEPASSPYETYLTSRVRDEAQDVTGYIGGFPGFKSSLLLTVPSPVASFWMFTSGNNPWPKSGVTVLPLYRMSLWESCDARHHAYVTADEIAMMEATDQCPAAPGMQAYHLDGIEGYILDQCPLALEYDCEDFADLGAPQKLWRRYSPTEQMSALILDSQLTDPVFNGYGGTLPGSMNLQPGTTKSFMGYVYPNVDSDFDGLPDGMERLYGMKWLSADTDCDGIDDLTEFPVSHVQPASLDPRSTGGCP